MHTITGRRKPRQPLPLKLEFGVESLLFDGKHQCIRVTSVLDEPPPNVAVLEMTIRIEQMNHPHLVACSASRDVVALLVALAEISCFRAVMARCSAASSSEPAGAPMAQSGGSPRARTGEAWRRTRHGHSLRHLLCVVGEFPRQGRVTAENSRRRVQLLRYRRFGDAHLAVERPYGGELIGSGTGASQTS